MPDEITVHHSVMVDIGKLTFHALKQRLAELSDRVRPDATVRFVTSTEIVIQWATTVPEEDAHA